MSNKVKFLLLWKTIHRFWIISVGQVSLFHWKYLLVKEKELFCWWEVSKFFSEALFANVKKVDVSEFQVKTFETPASKTDILIFIEIKGFWHKQFTSRFLST